MPENLSSVLASYPRVDGMYDAGAPFSLDVLIGTRASQRLMHQYIFLLSPVQISSRSLQRTHK